MEDIFAGSPINTPSMLCVADYLDALAWCDRVGGVAGTIARSQANLKVVEDFVAAHPWIHFLAQAPETRSNTSVCLTLDLPADKVKALAKLLETRAWPTTSPPTRTPRPACASGAARRWSKATWRR
jgi:phosphoserine aminotransferase